MISSSEEENHDSSDSYISSDSEEEEWQTEQKECLFCYGQYDCRKFVAAFPCGHYGVCAICCLKNRLLNNDTK